MAREDSVWCERKEAYAYAMQLRELAALETTEGSDPPSLAIQFFGSRAPRLSR